MRDESNYELWAALNSIGTPDPINPDPLGRNQQPRTWANLAGGGPTAANAAANAAEAAAGATAASGGKLGALFGNLGGYAKTGWKNIKAGKGVVPKAAPYARAGMAGYAALKALKGISDFSNNKRDTQSMINQVLNSAAANPNYRYALSQDQLNTLRQLQNGSFDKTADFDISDIDIGKVALGAIAGAVTGGGIPGALLGGGSALVDSVSNGMNGKQQQMTANLQSLYDALYESEMNAKAMRADAANQRLARRIYA